MCIRFHPISTVPKTRVRECFISRTNMNLSLKTVLSGSGLRVNEPGSSLKLGLYPHRFLILCTFNSELNCDLYMSLIFADRQEFDKNLTLAKVFNFQAVHSLKTRLRALLLARHSSSHQATLRFHTGGWGAPSCSGVMKWFFRSVVCFIRWEANLCPWSNLSRNQGEQWALFVLNLILIFDIMQFLNNFVSLPSTCWCVKVLLDSWLSCSVDCCQRWY